MRLYPSIPLGRANTERAGSLQILGRGVHDAGTAAQTGFTTAADNVGHVPWSARNARRPNDAARIVAIADDAGLRR